MNENGSMKHRNWRYTGGLIFMAYHVVALTIISFVPMNQLLILEAPVYIFGVLLMVITPGILDAVIRIFPHPSALRGALNPGTFIVSTLIWAALGYGAGVAAERIMLAKIPKTRA